MVFIDIVSGDVGEQNPNVNRPITLHILLPVPMVGHAIASILRELLCHWSNPNGCKAHSLDIVQLVAKLVYGF
jgi:hypothetical protein